MSRVLVTGATGFIGRHCIPELIKQGHEVHAVSSRKQEPSDGARWHQIDLLQPESGARICKQVRPQTVLHLAWCATPGKFWSSTENMDWVRATLDLMRALAESGGRRFVGAGSCAEYDWSAGLCDEASTALRPTTLYGASKLAVASILRAFAQKSGMSQAWGRIFFVYGPHEHPARLIASVIRALHRGEPARCSHGRLERDFLHVADVAGGFVRLVDVDVEGAVNICSGKAVPIREVVGLIGSKMNRPDLLQFDARSPGDDCPRVAGNNQRLLSTGWQPQFDLEKGIEATIRWWTENAQAAVQAG